MTDAVDWTDPCARAAALRSAYYNLLSGQQEQEIRTRSLEAEELVKFAPASLNALRSEMQDAEDACLAQQAGRSVSNKRFAITARHKRHSGGPFPGIRFIAS